MAKTPTMEEIIQRGVKEHALIDKHLELARKAAHRYAEQVVKPAVEVGMFPKALEAKKMLAHARSLPGKIAEAALHGADLHISGTAVAAANGVDDLGSPATVGGVTLGGIHTDGGGGR